jgi:hypothetical protein
MFIQFSLARLFFHGQLAVALGYSPNYRRSHRHMAESTEARMTCEQVTALLIDYITGELDPAIVSVCERHVPHCGDCESFLRTYRETVRATRTLRYDDIPEEMQSRVHDFLRQQISRAPRP